MVDKKEDPNAFTILCTISVYQFSKVLWDLEININLMPLEIFEQLGLETPSPTTMMLLMADRSIKMSVGIFYDALVIVDKFIFLANFVILDCELDIEIPIIL